jgi:hypothetical protein
MRTYEAASGNQNASYSPATAILQRLPFSSDYHSPATAILQRLPFPSAYHSPATAILQRLPFPSAYHSPATAILQRLPFPSAYHSPATTILRRLPFSSAYHSPAPPANSFLTVLEASYRTLRLSYSLFLPLSAYAPTESYCSSRYLILISTVTHHQSVHGHDHNDHLYSTTTSTASTVGSVTTTTTIVTTTLTDIVHANAKRAPRTTAISSSKTTSKATSNTTSKTSSATSIPAIRSHDRATFLLPLLFFDHYLSPATFSPVPTFLWPLPFKRLGVLY